MLKIWIASISLLLHSTMQICFDLSVGTNPHYFDIVNKGVIAKEWRTDDPNNIKTVANKISDYFYVQYTGSTKLDVGLSDLRTAPLC